MTQPLATAPSSSNANAGQRSSRRRSPSSSAAGTTISARKSSGCALKRAHAASVPAPITVTVATSTQRQVLLSRVRRTSNSSGVVTRPASARYSGGHHGRAIACCSHGCSAACA